MGSLLASFLMDRGGRVENILIYQLGVILPSEKLIKSDFTTVFCKAAWKIFLKLRNFTLNMHLKPLVLNV